MASLQRPIIVLKPKVSVAPNPEPSEPSNNKKRKKGVEGFLEYVALHPPKL